MNLSVPDSMHTREYIPGRHPRTPAGIISILVKYFPSNACHSSGLPGCPIIIYQVILTTTCICILIFWKYINFFNCNPLNLVRCQFLCCCFFFFSLYSSQSHHLQPWLPNNAVAFAPFKTVISSISSGLISNEFQYHPQ